MKQTRLHNKAAEAFRRSHGGRYFDPFNVGNQRWVAGWKRGYTAGRRDQKRAQQRQTESDK